MYLRIARKLIGFAFLSLFFFIVLMLLPNRKLRRISIQLFMRAYCRLLSISIHFEGQDRRDLHGLLLANHVSYLDIIVIGSLFPCSFLAKQEIRSWPFVGRLARLVGTNFVTREKVSHRFRVLMNLKKLIAQETVCIFPEGTTSFGAIPRRDDWHRGHAYLSWKSSQRSYALGLHYQDQKRLAWVGDDAFFPHLIRTMAKKAIRVYVSGKYIETNQVNSRVKQAWFSFDAVSLEAEKAFTMERSARSQFEKTSKSNLLSPRLSFSGNLSPITNFSKHSWNDKHQDQHNDCSPRSITQKIV